MTPITAIVLAQLCSSFLPPANAGVEWYRGQTIVYRDTLVRAPAGLREYKRTESGKSRSAITRTLSCERSSSGEVLVERMPSSEVKIPVNLGMLKRVTIDGAVITRIATPPGARPNTLWFSIMRHGPRLYGLKRGVGIDEIRETATVHSDHLRSAFSAASSRSVEQRVRELERKAAEASRREEVLRDSLVDLRKQAAVAAAKVAEARRGSAKNNVERSPADSPSPPSSLRRDDPESVGVLAEPRVTFDLVQRQNSIGEFDAALSELERLWQVVSTWENRSRVHSQRAEMESWRDRILRACRAFQAVRRERGEPSPLCVNVGGV